MLGAVQEKRSLPVAALDLLTMIYLGIIALIVLVVAGVMVLRVKSDPMEKESVREFLSESEPASKTSTDQADR